MIVQGLQCGARWAMILLAPFALVLFAPVAGGTLGNAAQRVSAASGGPVILGGDDLTDHGGVDASGDPQTGWLYIQRALESIAPNVTRQNDGSIAALGAEPSDATCCDAGAAIGVAAAAAGFDVTYYNGGDAIEQFFADLEAGLVTPAIIWIAGSDASFNDLHDDPDEPAALTANAQAISGFVNSGGGLMSHGTEYGWLQALLPSAESVNQFVSVFDDLVFTAQGSADLPELTLADINAGPWHNYFDGDLGGLKVLVESTVYETESGASAPVIIGGATVTIVPTVAPVTATPQSEDSPTPSATESASASGGGGSGRSPTRTPTPQSTVAASTAIPPSPTLVSQPLGVISAPDTGQGAPQNQRFSAILVAAASVGVMLAGTGAWLKLRG